MKIQVLTRSFYEDSYLDFFIKYYLELGFDRIVIFKADKEELGEYSLDFLNEDEKNRIIIKYVANEGNNIYKNPNNFTYYVDTNYEWSLHVDVDEFLIIDRNKYHRIHDYIIDIHKIMSVPLNEIYNIKFRWLCINKLNDRWNDETIINPELITDNTIYLNSFNDYILKNKLEIYSFVKGMYQTNKIIVDNNKMDAHIIIFKENLDIKNKIIIDNTFTNINKYKSPLFGSKSKPETNYCNGFILHFNTRSYSNSLTKCLVTQLRDNKKITDLADFREFINNLTDEIIENINLSKLSNEKIEELKHKYKSFLNSKSFFPNKITNFNNKYSYLITKDNYLKQIKSIIDNIELTYRVPFVNINKEKEILEKLCNKFNINYNKLRVILSLF
jgi:hypothetical protein